MKKRSPVVFFMAVCLAGFIGQLAAFGQTTTAVYAVDATISYKVGKTTGSLGSVSGTAVFLSDGSFSLIGGATNGLHFAGTYSVAKNGKTAKVTSSKSETATMESYIASLIETDLSGVTATVKSLKWSKLSLSDGAPVSATVKGGGKGCEGKHCKSFTFTVTATYGACQGTCSSL